MSIPDRRVAFLGAMVVQGPGSFGVALLSLRLLGPCLQLVDGNADGQGCSAFSGLPTSGGPGDVRAGLPGLGWPEALLLVRLPGRLRPPV